MKKVILFDIDHTLFDTVKFRYSVYEKLAKKLKYNYDDKFIKLARESEEITVRAKGYFDPTTFMKSLIDLVQSNFKTGDLENEFWNSKNFENAIYSDVLPALKKIKKIDKTSIGILSTGETNFQRKKVEILRELLNEEHIHIFVNKLTEINEVLNKYRNFEIYVVDNLLSVLELAKKVSGHVRTIHIRRSDRWDKSGGEDFTPDKEMEDLKDIVSFIRN